jgi:hypothetical protein
VRHGDWKYLQDGNVDLLFNLKDDLGERRDVYRHHPQVMTDLKQRLATWESEMARHQPEFLVK